MDFDKTRSLVEEMNQKIEESPKKMGLLSRAVERIKDHLSDSNRNQKSFNQSMEQGSSIGSKMEHTIKKYVKAFLGMRMVKNLAESTIVAAGKLQQQFSMMGGMFGDQDIGKSYFVSLQNYALQTGQDIQHLAGITQQFLSTTKNTDHLMGLNKVAEKLMLKNTSQGMDGAAYAINEALSGQFTSLKNRFNLSSFQLEPIKQAIHRGNLEGIIEAFDTSLQSAGITDKVVDAYRNSAPAQFRRMVSGFQNQLAMVSTKALGDLQPMLAQINNWMQTDGAAQFFYCRWQWSERYHKRHCMACRPNQPKLGCDFYHFIGRRCCLYTSWS